MTRAAAKANCEAMGGRLAILSTDALFDDAVAVKPDNLSCWIGGGDEDGDSVYRWDDGHLVSEGETNDKWQAGHDDNTNGLMLLSVRNAYALKPWNHHTHRCTCILAGV